MEISINKPLREYCQNNCLWDISEFLDGENCKYVGLQLRVTDGALNKIDNSGKDYRECAYKVLIAWQEQKPDDTLENLLTALQKLNLELPIRHIKAHFKIAEPVQVCFIHEHITSKTLLHYSYLSTCFH